MKRFNIRVYGIIQNDQGDVLLADEERFGHRFTKFPGGGLEFGEGTIDCLRRECKEEFGGEIGEVSHYYTTDYFQQSAFNVNDQLISIYYKAKICDKGQLRISTKKFDFVELSDEMISFRWIPLHDLSENEVTFPVDKIVAELLRNDK